MHTWMKGKKLGVVGLWAALVVTQSDGDAHGRGCPGVCLGARETFGRVGLVPGSHRVGLCCSHGPDPIN
jgi:hypothetical protein